MDKPAGLFLDGGVDERARLRMHGHVAGGDDESVRFDHRRDYAGYCVSVRGRRCFVALAGGTSELCSISGDAPMCGSTPRSGLRPPPDEPGDDGALGVP